MARAADCLGPSRIAGREQERPAPTGDADDVDPQLMDGLSVVTFFQVPMSAATRTRTTSVLWQGHLSLVMWHSHRLARLVVTHLSLTRFVRRAVLRIT